MVLRLNQMLYALCLSYHSNTKAVLLHAFSKAGTPQRVDCLTSRLETALTAFPKVVPRFRNLSITILAFCQLSQAAASIMVHTKEVSHLDKTFSRHFLTIDVLI